MASQLAMLLACTVLVDTAVLGSYAFAAGRGSRALRHSRLVTWLECTFGTALMIFGIRLLEWRR
jgi:threonine/homoserine/homoserine lactone efflux protein